MMKVYIVCTGVSYEGNDTLKAFKEKEKAELFTNELKQMTDKERWALNIPFFDYVFIEEMEVF